MVAPSAPITRVEDCSVHFFLSFGSFCNFCTSTTSFRHLFPGIRSKLCTLRYHFFVPFYRELVLSWGMMSASWKSIVNALSQSKSKLDVCNDDGYTSNAVDYLKKFMKNLWFEIFRHRSFLSLVVLKIFIRNLFRQRFLGRNL